MSALVEFSPRQVALIKKQFAPDLNEAEFDTYSEMAKIYGLNPFKGEILALVYNKDDPERRKVSYITTIGGYRLIAARSGDYLPGKDWCEVDDANIDPDTNPKGIVSATAVVYKFVHGEKHPIEATVLWEEFAPIDDEYEWVDTGEVWPDSGRPKKTKQPTGKRTIRKGTNWVTMPEHMLKKCAEALALRKGWPETLNGLYAEEEMEHARIPVDLELSATEAAELGESEKRRGALGYDPDAVINIFLHDKIDPIPVGTFHDEIVGYIRTINTANDLEGFFETNATALRQFWALDKAAGLSIKEEKEKRLKALANETGEGVSTEAEDVEIIEDSGD